jgi:hypothetical protein
MSKNTQRKKGFWLYIDILITDGLSLGNYTYVYPVSLRINTYVYPAMLRINTYRHLTGCR